MTPNTLDCPNTRPSPQPSFIYKWWDQLADLDTSERDKIHHM